MPRKPSARSIVVGDLCAAMEMIAPTWLAADWDNVGLLVGANDWPATRVLLTIDLTPQVAAEAIAMKANVVIAYHPPIFRAVKQMRPDPLTQEGIAAEMLSRRIAVYSPHTALDGAEAGTNATLARLAGIVDAEPFNAAIRPTSECKLVTFVPRDDVGPISEALFSAGAGHIGDYAKCSFRIDGQGTFHGADTTNPVVGQKNRLETIGEIRLETVVPTHRLPDVTAALLRAHPYDEPAFDIYPLTSAPAAQLGQGRVGRFSKPIRLGDLASRLATIVGAAAPALVGKPQSKVRRGFVCVGSAGALPFDASAGPLGSGDVVITGELRHHDALQYERCGCSVIILGHSTSERPVLKPLSQLLRKSLPGMNIRVSRKDRDPIRGIQ